MLETQVDSNNGTSTSTNPTNENEKKDEKLNNTKKLVKKECEIELSFASFYYSLKVSKGKGKLLIFLFF